MTTRDVRGILAWQRAMGLAEQVVETHLLPGVRLGYSGPAEGGRLLAPAAEVGKLISGLRNAVSLP